MIVKFAICEDTNAELVKNMKRTMIESGRDVYCTHGLSIVHKASSTKLNGPEKQTWRYLRLC